MGRRKTILLRIAVAVVAIVPALVVLFVMPSLLGALMVVMLVFACADLLVRRYRADVRTLNASLRAVADHEGAVENVAKAFAKSGPLRSQCLDYAHRLVLGEDVVAAAIESRVPLQLGTAIALYSPGSLEKQAESDSSATSASVDGQEPPREKESEVDRATDSSRLEVTAEDVMQRISLVEHANMPAYGQFLYLGATALITCCVLGFIATFIVPTFEMMFEEFGLTMPFRWVYEAAPLVWIVALGGIFLVLLFPMCALLRLIGFRLPRWIPITPRAAEKRAELLTGFADGIDAGWPLGRTMTLGHAISRSPVQRRRLESAMRMVQQGAEPLQAIHRTGWLDSREAAWLADASPGRAAQLLREFGAETVRDSKENIRWAMAFVYPAVIIVLGGIVMAFSVAFFGGLIALVQGLS